MSHVARVLIVTVLAVVMQGCQTGSAKGLSASDKAKLQQVTAAWEMAVNANNFDAVAATYTSDAILLPPNGPLVQGRENIKKFFVEFPPFKDMKLNLVEIDGRGDMAYVRGVYSMTITPPGIDPIHEVGKYLEIRRKQANGSWLISRDMFSSDLPASH
jgi:uncharacterized protein (TIGR02246 family)